MSDTTSYMMRLNDIASQGGESYMERVEVTSNTSSFMVRGGDGLSDAGSYMVKIDKEENDEEEEFTRANDKGSITDSLLMKLDKDDESQNTGIMQGEKTNQDTNESPNQGSVELGLDRFKLLDENLK